MKNIRKIRISRGLSQGRLAELCGWENAAGRISNYENLSREPTLGDLSKIADALKVRLKDLLFMENEEITDSNEAANYIKLPILEMSELAAWRDGKFKDTGRSFKMYIAGIDTKKNMVGVVIEGDAMTSAQKDRKSIGDGDIVTLDVGATPAHGDIVMAFVAGEPKLREYAKDGTEKFLRAYNPDYNNIKIDENIEIFGIVVSNQVKIKN